MGGDGRPSGDALLDTPGRIADGIVGLESELRYTYLNGRAETLSGADREALLGQLLGVPLSPSTRAAGEPHVRRAVEAGTEQYGGRIAVEDSKRRSPSGSRPEADDDPLRGAVFVVELDRATL